MLTPAFGKLKKEPAIAFIDAANECLKDTLFMYLLAGDGVCVMLTKQMVATAKGLFDRPMGDYSK
jgi:hypothetical protein